jgi:ribonuclease D
MDPRPQHFVDTPAALEQCAASVARAARVALDTESNGFHAYFEKVCLVQLSTGEEEFAVDTLAVGLGPLLPLLTDPAREVILHAAEFDVLTLRRDYGLRMGRIFDTHAAAKVLGIVKVGLGNLLEEQLGVKLLEDEQRSDWGKRPLTASQLSYAFADVSYLLTLRDKLAGQLEAQGRTAEAHAEFDRVRVKEPRPRVFDAEAWQKMKSARTLDGRGRAVLRALFLLRDARSRELDRPPFKVLSDLFMSEVARRLPRTEEALAQIPGTSPQQLRKLSSAVLAAVAEGLAGPIPARPGAQPQRGPPWKRNAGQDPVLEARYEALRAWRKGRAELRKVEVQVIAPNAVLLNVAKAEPADREALARVDGMDPFRVEQYGEEILSTLRLHAVKANGQGKAREARAAQGELGDAPEAEGADGAAEVAESPESAPESPAQVPTQPAAEPAHEAPVAAASASEARAPEAPVRKGPVQGSLF